MNATINHEQRLFVIPEGKGYSCLGFDVCHKRASALAKELGEPQPSQEIDSLESLAEYNRLVMVARERNRKTGWRSESELTPELKGRERKRVEVAHQWKPDGPVEIVRFIVGKSMGFIPCHLEIKTRRSSGGPAVCFGKILSVREVKG